LASTALTHASIPTPRAFLQPREASPYGALLRVWKSRFIAGFARVDLRRGRTVLREARASRLLVVKATPDVLGSRRHGRLGL